jgi:hypothetical protein
VVVLLVVDLRQTGRVDLQMADLLVVGLHLVDKADLLAAALRPVVVLRETADLLLDSIPR